jgi:hypothetical protein
MSAQGTASSALAAADEAGRSEALEHLARVGLVAYGVVHLLVAWLALQLGWGGSSDEPADQSGALATLADQPLGTPLLWVVALGLIALAAWQAAEVFRWRYGWSASGSFRRKALWKSGKALAKAVVYGSLAVLAIRFATGSAGSGGSSQQSTAAGVLGWPGGQWIVAAAGAVLIGIGVQHVWRGVTSRFLKEVDLSGCPSSTTRFVQRVGQVGFPAKGVALGLVGGLLGYAALTFDPSKASGLDGAMRTLLEAPYGRWLLTAVALGIAAFAVFLFVRARYPERT